MVPALALQGAFAGIGFGAGAAAFASVVATTIINVAIASVLGKILAPSAPQSGRDTRGLQTNVKSNVAPRTVVYGECIAGGPFLEINTSGSENSLLTMIVALTTHPIEDVLGVFIGDQYFNISTDGSGNDTVTNDLDSLYFIKNGKFGSDNSDDPEYRVAKIIKVLGWGWADNRYVNNHLAQKCVDDRDRSRKLDALMERSWGVPVEAGLSRDATTGLYPSAGYKAVNCSYVFIQLKYEQDVWGGTLPKFKFHVKGKNLYNPALDSTNGGTGSHRLDNPDTWVYSNDWTLAVLDYLTDNQYGLGAKTVDDGINGPEEIDWPMAIESYNVSSELVTNGLAPPDNVNIARYTVDGIFEVSQTPISIMEALLTSGAGELVYAQGKYKILPGVYREPNADTDIINEDNIISNISIKTANARSEVFNKASGVFVDKAYDDTTAPSQTNLPLFESSDFPLVDPRKSTITQSIDLVTEDSDATDNGTTVSVPVPGSLQTDDFIIAVTTASRAGAGSGVNSLDGFTAINTQQHFDPDYIFTIWARIVDGTETGTFDWTYDNPARVSLVMQVWRNVDVSGLTIQDAFDVLPLGSNATESATPGTQLSTKAINTTIDGARAIAMFLQSTSASTDIFSFSNSYGNVIQDSITEGQVLAMASKTVPISGSTGVTTASTTAVADWETVPFVLKPSSIVDQNPYELIDGEEIIREFDFPYTTNAFTAQRLAKIQIERSRRGITIAFEGTLDLIKYSVGDNVYFEILSDSKYANETFYNKLGFDSTVQPRPDTPIGDAYYKQFKIVDMQYTENSTIAVTMIEEDDGIYDWNNGDASLPQDEIIAGRPGDNPYATVLPPSWDVISPLTSIEEVVGTEPGSPVRTLVRWVAPVKDSADHDVLDITNIGSYRLEYGVVDNPSQAVAEDRVSTWIPAGTLIADPTISTQGPIALTAMFLDNVDYDFRVRSVTYTERASAWAYYSVFAGADYSPSSPPPNAFSTFYYIKPINGTAIKNSIGTLTVEAHYIDATGDNLITGGTVKLYDPLDQELTVGNGYRTGSDGYTGVLDSTNITNDIVITLKDGVSGEPLDTITLVDITDGLDPVVGWIDAINTLAWVRDDDGITWDPSDTSTQFDVTFSQNGVDVARWARLINRDGAGTLSDGGATTHSFGSNLNTGNITPTIFNNNSAALTVQFVYFDGTYDFIVRETALTTRSGKLTPARYYIKPLNGTAIKNSTGTLTVEAHQIDSTGDTHLSTGTIKLYDDLNQELTVGNGYRTGSDGYTGVLDSTNISNDILITLKDGPSGDPLDTIALVDITDGIDSLVGYINPTNGLAWVQRPSGKWKPLGTTTKLNCNFVKGGADVARVAYEITLDPLDGTLTGASATHSDTDLNAGRVTIDPTGDTTSTMSVKFTYNFDGEISVVSETVQAVVAQGPELIVGDPYIQAGASEWAGISGSVFYRTGEGSNSTDAISMKPSGGTAGSDIFWFAERRGTNGIYDTQTPGNKFTITINYRIALRTQSLASFWGDVVYPVVRISDINEANLETYYGTINQPNHVFTQADSINVWYDESITFQIDDSAATGSRPRYISVGLFAPATLASPEYKIDYLQALIGPQTFQGADNTGLVPAPVTTDSLKLLKGDGTWGLSSFEKLTAETTAAVTVVDYFYEPGDVRRYGAVGDDSTDCSAAFQDALSIGNIRVRIPAGIYRVDGTTLSVAAGTHIYCEPGTIVRRTANGSNVGWIRFVDKSGLVIEGNNSTWEYLTKPDTSPIDEHRHIFDIRGSSDVLISDVHANKAGGDGFYIGPGSTNTLSERVTLRNCHADNCLRQGLSITSAKTFRMYGGSMTNTTGTAPSYGIDIEPNSNTDTMEDILIDGVYFSGNDQGPVLVALFAHPGATDKYISIRIQNCVSNNDDSGYNVLGAPLSTGQYTGTIQFINCQSTDTLINGIVVTNWPVEGPAVEYINHSIFNPNQAASSSEQNGAAVVVYTDGTKEGLGYIGNVHFHNMTINDKDANVTSYYYFRMTNRTGSHDGTINSSILSDTSKAWATNALVGMKITNTGDTPFSRGIITANTDTTITATLSGGGDNNWDTNDTYVISQGIQNVHVTGYQNLEGQSTVADMIWFGGAGTFEDIGRYVNYSATVSFTLSESNYFRYVNNEGATGTVTVTLDDLPADFPEVTFEIRTAQNLVVDPDGNSHIYPGSNGVGKYIQSNTIGSRLTLRRRSRTEWQITEETGTWTRQA